MKHLLPLLVFFSFPLFSCSGVYTSCVDKVRDAHVIRGKTLFIPVSKTTRLVYSFTQPKEKILKYDPFLSLYLVEDADSFQYPFIMTMPKKLKTSLVTQKKACSGKIIHHQVGLNHFGVYSASFKQPALITNACCVLEALSTPFGLIEKPYLQHFLNTKKVVYGDIGIRVEQKGKAVVVIARDPYLKNNPFQKGDKIISFDTLRFPSASLLMQKILFSPLGSYHRIGIQRGAKKHIFHVSITKRYGGGMLSDTFLEREGALFDNSLHLLKVSAKLQKFGLEVGDKLLAVNGHSVKTEAQLRSYLVDFHNYSQLLIERNKFQFFVNIK